MEVMVFKNGKKPKWFSPDVEKLDEQQICETVNNLSYCGLQICAAGFFLAMRAMKIKPKDILEVIESARNDLFKKGVLTPDKSNKNSV